MTRSRLYRGAVMHARAGAVRNAFRYPIYAACLDLDELDDLDRRLRLFSLERANLFSLRGADYALAAGITRPSRRPAPTGTLAERARARLDAAGIDPGSIDRVCLITQPRVLGHVFNPVSFFCALDGDGAVVATIAEINNTYDQTFAYVLRGDDAISDKQFFVSPFIADGATYRWRFAAVGGASLDIRVSVRVRGRPLLVARLEGSARPLSDLELLKAFVRLPALPAQIWTRIHLQALRLRLFGLQYRRPLRQPPATSHQPPATPDDPRRPANSGELKAES